MADKQNKKVDYTFQNKTHKKIYNQSLIRANKEKLVQSYQKHRYNINESGRVAYEDPAKFDFDTFDPHDLPGDGAISITNYGKRRTGKSFWCNWYMSIRKRHFDEVYVFTQTKAGNNEYEGACEDVFIFEGWDPDKVDMIIQRAMGHYQKTGKRKKILMMVEDMVSKSKIRHDEMLNALYSRGRHAGITVIFNTQRPTAVPPIVRDNTDIAVVFNQLSTTAAKTIAEDYLGRLNPKTALELINMYTQDQHAVVIEVWKNAIIPTDFIKVMKAVHPGKYKMECCSEYHRAARQIENDRRAENKPHQETDIYTSWSGGAGNNNGGWLKDDNFSLF